MTRTTVLHVRNQYLAFSAAHFTIFSATERERLHGHNFAVSAKLTTPVADDGLCFDYNVIKRKLRALCDALDEYLLLPSQSPHLSVSEDGDEVIAVFNGKRLVFPADETIILPVANVTAEELSHYLLLRILEDGVAESHDIREIAVSVASGPGQSATTQWHHERGVL